MAEVSQAWLDRVKHAQQSAAERLGIDISEMQPPRDGSTGEVQEPAAATPAPAAQPEPVAAAAQQAPEPSPQPTPTPVAAAAESVASAQAPTATATPTEDAAATVAAQAPTAVQSNGSAAAAAAERVAPVGRAAVLESFEAGQEGINRREFLAYAYGGALSLLTLEGGLATYQFMYPRFREGEFGGEFNLGAATVLPQVGIDPEGNTTGKFWLINTDDGPRALYMVCTHLGCLYKWEPSNNRFECPCHGSKFSREGFYIEGPAPRSLDQFIIKVVQDGSVVAETADQGDLVAAPAVPAPEAEIVVDTGKRLPGKAAADSPAKKVASAKESEPNDTVA
jgi:cytochrome b6-f complex iron-sulfur subunit